MSLFSVEDDFLCNTLNAVPGLWGKLRYVSGLRQKDEHYEHWGLARKYGKDAADSAIRGAHRDLLLQILRMPLPQLLELTVSTATQHDVSVKEFVARLVEECETMLPYGIPKSSARHFRTILESLLFLAPGCTDANRQAS